MTIEKIINNGIEGFKILDENKNEYFIVIDLAKFTSLEDQESEAIRVYQQIKFFEVPENKTALQNELNKIDPGIAKESAEYLKAVETIRNNLFQP